jgi:glycosyltransferase involved in cell wall biosynthesis
MKKTKDSDRPAQLRVSVVEPSGLLYGSELALLDILERLDRTRFVPEVILPKQAPFSERLRAENIPCRELLLPLAHHAPRLKKALTYAKLARHWWRNRPDLVYVNQGGILRPVAAIARRLNLPILCQIQTLEDARWVTNMRGEHPQVFAFVCNSRFIRAETRVPEERLSLLYQGYKPRGLYRKRAKHRRRALEIGLLGRICQSKGHYLLVEVAHQLKRMNSTEFHFRFIGDAATASERKQIQDLVMAQGLESWIEFRGYRTDIGAELAALDLLAIPSVAEPLGRVFFEAAEARVPVLISDSGGLAELSGVFRVGCSFKSGKGDDFLSKLHEIKARYDVVAQEFAVAAERMLGALDLGAYVGVMERMLEGVASRQPISLTWLGNEFGTNSRQP